MHTCNQIGKIDLTDAEITMYGKANIELSNDCQSGRYDDTDRQRGIAAREAAAREAAFADSVEEESSGLKALTMSWL